MDMQRNASVISNIPIFSTGGEILPILGNTAVTRSSSPFLQCRTLWGELEQGATMATCTCMNGLSFTLK